MEDKTCFVEKLIKEGITILYSAGEALTEVPVQQVPDGGRGMSHAISGGTASQAERTARARLWGGSVPIGCQPARPGQLEWNEQGGMEQKLGRGHRPGKAFQLMKGLSGF